jgi:hypothetical protein
MPETKRYSGGCHCGKVRYEVEADLGMVISCNCSICTKKGLLWNFVPPEQFTLLSGEDELGEYLFNRHAIHHLFCKHCGTEAFARGTNPVSGADVVALNVRCFDNIEISELKLTPFDGRSL